MAKRWTGLAMGLALALGLAADAAAQGAAAQQSTLQRVRDRGAVVCGVNTGRAGFSALNSRGEWEGMDVESCRAYAAAIFGDPARVRFVPTSNQQRFTALQSGEVDVLARNVTWTFTRDTAGGMEFPVITFYDGQGFMVPRSLGVTTARELDGVTLCVLPGSTSEKVAAQFFRRNRTSYTPVVIDNVRELNAAFFAGRCDAYMQAKSGLMSIRATSAPNPADYIILPETFGKDPMGPVVRHGDSQWRDIIAWVTYAMFDAEERGITSRNVQQNLTSDEEEVRRMLGVLPGGGRALGLDDRWAYNVIRHVGNYAEVFDRTVGANSPLRLERGLNALWNQGGLLFSPDFQ